MKYKPHDYQAYAIDYIETHPIAAVLLDMGLGKTSIKMAGITEVNASYTDWQTNQRARIPAIRMVQD